jgi:hypothetical protein
LLDTIILHNIRFKENHDSYRLTFNDQREIVPLNKGDKKTPLDVNGNIQELVPEEVLTSLKSAVRSYDFSDDKQENRIIKRKYLNAIRQFGQQYFKIELENILNLQKNTRLAKVWEREIERLEKEEIDYESLGIILSFCNMVFQKDKEFLDNEGYITEQGKKIIQQTLKDTAKSLPAT